MASFLMEKLEEMERVDRNTLAIILTDPIRREL
jgi:hypothetical protein